MKSGIKTVLSLSLIFALSVSLIGCGKKMSYQFLHGSDEIQEIQIAHIELDYEYQRFYLDRLDDGVVVLADIEDTSEFIEKFSNDVIFKKNGLFFGDPSALGHGDYVIKITYSNGDFELIGHYAQCRVNIAATERGGRIYAGQMGNFGYCSEDDFINFLNLYLDDPILS